MGIAFASPLTWPVQKIYFFELNINHCRLIVDDYALTDQRSDPTRLILNKIIQVCVGLAFFGYYHKLSFML